MITYITIAILAIIVIALLNTNVLSSTLRKYKAPYVIKTKNETSDSQTAILFGMNMNLLEKNFGSPSGITHTPQHEVLSYLALLNMSANRPCILYKIAITTTKQQLNDLLIKHHEVDANGNSSQSNLNVRSYVTNEIRDMENDTVKLEIKYDEIISGNAWFEYNIQANTEIEFMFYYKVNVTGTVKLFNHLIYKLTTLWK